MLNDKLTTLTGIGPKRCELLKSELGLESVADLLFFSPRRYIDRSSLKHISDTLTGELVTIVAEVQSSEIKGQKKKFLEVIVSDESEDLSLVFWGGISYFQKLFSPGELVVLSGKIDFFKTKKMIHPDFDFIETVDAVGKTLNTARIIPLYPSTEKLKGAHLDSRNMRRIVREALDKYIIELTDPLPEEIIEKFRLTSLQKAVHELHFPASLDSAESARRRLAFNELYLMQYYFSIAREQFIIEHQIKRKSYESDYFNIFLQSLPFTLTAGQQKALNEIATDLDKTLPMNRLLQGDVGSGKTVVALASAMKVIDRNRQVAFMVPTEVLANQHYQTALKLIPSDVKTALLTGSVSAKDRKVLYEDLANGKINLIIGTQALFQNDVKFKELGLVIIDEQHRFGVGQRGLLRAKGDNTDLLVMTATPIPRSLYLTLYGDLDLSEIREKPADRKKIQTYAFPQKRLAGVYNSIEKYLTQGRQIYYVLPLIEESAKLDLKSAKGVFETLSIQFKHRHVALLHGQMPPAEKSNIMTDFKNGQIDILVTTSVIEVGIDVPNANVIIIEHAERFGLSQLHQLRGRVGRGEHQSFCVLVYPDDLSSISIERLTLLTNSEDGFAIAEADLINRGAGELTGSRQHGISEFAFADLATDLNLLLSAKEGAQLTLANSDYRKNLPGIADGVDFFKKLPPSFHVKNFLKIIS